MNLFIMAILYCREHESLASLLHKIIEASEQELEIHCMPASIVSQNKANKAVLEAFGIRVDKKIHVSEEAVVSEEAPTTTPPQQVDVPPTARKTGTSRPWKKWFVYPRVLIPIAVLFLLIGGSLAAYAWYNLPQAYIQLSVSKQTVAENAIISLRTEQQSIDQETMSVPVVVQSVVQETSREFPTTGIKETGDKALGSIVVYNWTNVSVQLPAGHTFTVNANQEGAGFTFVSRKQVTVPPREEVTRSPGEKSTTAGSATVEVEASVLGVQHNLPANLFFTVQGYTYSDTGLQGINPSEFTGGTTKEIKVLAEQDKVTARTALRETLEADARKELEANGSGTQKLIQETIKVEVVSEEYSVAIGAEADTFTAQMTVRVSGQVYDEGDVATLLEQTLQKVVPDGFILSEDTVMQTVRYHGKTEEGFTQLDVRIEGLVVPSINIVQLQESLRGTTVEEAQTIITGLDRVHEGSVVLQPKLPGFLQRLPQRSDRITITISEE